MKTVKRAVRGGKGKLRRSTRDTRPLCFWCHKDTPKLPDGAYWSGWDVAVSGVWPYAGVKVCGPDCKERPLGPDGQPATVRAMRPLVPGT